MLRRNNIARLGLFVLRAGENTHTRNILKFVQRTTRRVRAAVAGRAAAAGAAAAAGGFSRPDALRGDADVGTLQPH